LALFPIHRKTNAEQECEKKSKDVSKQFIDENSDFIGIHNSAFKSLAQFFNPDMVSKEADHAASIQG
jgi:hypothetical protein